MALGLAGVVLLWHGGAALGESDRPVSTTARHALPPTRNNDEADQDTEQIPRVTLTFPAIRNDGRHVAPKRLRDRRGLLLSIIIGAALCTFLAVFYARSGAASPDGPASSARRPASPATPTVRSQPAPSAGRDTSTAHAPIHRRAYTPYAPPRHSHPAAPRPTASPVTPPTTPAATSTPTSSPATPTPTPTGSTPTP